MATLGELLQELEKNKGATRLRTARSLPAQPCLDCPTRSRGQYIGAGEPGRSCLASLRIETDGEGARTGLGGQSLHHSARWDKHLIVPAPIARIGVAKDFQVRGENAACAA
jgi:hypothetical protein